MLTGISQQKIIMRSEYDDFINEILNDRARYNIIITSSLEYDCLEVGRVYEYKDAKRGISCLAELLFKSRDVLKLKNMHNGRTYTPSRMEMYTREVSIKEV